MASRPERANPLCCQSTQRPQYPLRCPAWNASLAVRGVAAFPAARGMLGLEPSTFFRTDTGREPNQKSDRRWARRARANAGRKIYRRRRFTQYRPTSGTKGHCAASANHDAGANAGRMVDFRHGGQSGGARHLRFSAARPGALPARSRVGSVRTAVACACARAGKLPRRHHALAAPRCGWRAGVGDPLSLHVSARCLFRPTT